MTRVAVAATSTIAAEAGAALANSGGNAVDAVLGSALVSMCTDIGIVSPGGGALITIWPPSGSPVVIDGCPEMPGRAKPSARFGEAMWEILFDYKGETQQGIGYGSIATPGAFAAMDESSRRFGSLPWSDLMQPAIGWAQSGFPLRGGAAEYLLYTHESIYSWDEESNRIVHRADGSPLQDGDKVFIPDLADSLTDIAENGVKTLYGGALGQRIAAAVEEAGGLLGLADLEAYRAIVREPIALEIEGWEIATAPPPSIGGPCLAAMLHLLAGCPETAFNQAAIRWLVDTQDAVLNHRAAHLDGAGAAFEREALRLLSLARKLGPAQLLEAPSTIHASGIDDSGLACAFTSSAGYGSGAIAPGTGIWLNNSLGEIDLHPKGLIGVAPGTRLVSNMAPTVARRHDGATLAIGSPGASRITTAIAQSLWQHIVFGRSLAAAIEHPRLHLEPFVDDRHVAFERGLSVMPVEGYALREVNQPHMYFGGVQAARWGVQEGLEAVADARRSGAVAYGGRGVPQL